MKGKRKEALPAVENQQRWLFSDPRFRKFKTAIADAPPAHRSPEERSRDRYHSGRYAGSRPTPVEGSALEHTFATFLSDRGHRSERYHAGRIIVADAVMEDLFSPVEVKNNDTRHP